MTHNRTDPIRLVVTGALGRMGARIRALASGDPRFALVGAVDRDGPVEGAEALSRGAFDLVIDVSSDAGARGALSLAQEAKAALLVGTTGIAEETRQSLAGASSEIPVMIAPNMSVGVAVMKHLAATAARLLGPTWDVGLVEHHHNAKKDAPSGTALRLAEAVERAAGRPFPREAILAARGGDIVGEHSLRFMGQGEYLEITHRATTRDLFVLGALRAGAWLARRTPGRYEIEQAIGLDSSS